MIKSAPLSLKFEEERETQSFSKALASLSQPGDLLSLCGPLGVGKSFLARSFLRELAKDPTLEVPSPTFCIFSLYPLPHFPVLHADLYRITSLEEFYELGIEDVEEGTLFLFEWYDLLSPPFASQNRLQIQLSFGPSPHSRMVECSASGSWIERLVFLQNTLKEAFSFL